MSQRKENVMSTLTERSPTLLDKPIRVVATAGFHAKYGGIERALYVKMALQILRKFPHDMLVFSMADEDHLQVKLAGYHLKTEELDETTVVYRSESLPIETFWVKVDDYGEEYVITFLFPEEY